MSTQKGIPPKYYQEALSILSDFWQNALASVSRPSARKLVGTLNPANPLGIPEGVHGVAFATKAGEETIIDTVCRVKALHPEKLVAVRCGEFFEFYLCDAIMANEYCSLAPMAGQFPRAGCPLGNLQSVANSLTEAGFSVVVVEQALSTGRGRKQRFIAQVLTPSSPSWTFGLQLDTNWDIDFQESPPVAALESNLRGFKFVEVYPETSRTYIGESLTWEGLRIAMRRSGRLPAKLYLHASVTDLARSMIEAEYERDGYSKSVLPYSVCRLALGGEATAVDIESSVERLVRLDLGLAATDLFDRRTAPTDSGFKPISYSTAANIGLVKSPGIPDLVGSLLPPEAKKASRSLLRQILLRPPTRALARRLRAAIKSLSKEAGLKDFIVSEPSRYLKPLSSLEIQADSLREILKMATDVGALASTLPLDVSTVFDVACHLSFSADKDYQTFSSALTGITELLAGSTSLEAPDQTAFNIGLYGDIPDKIFCEVDSLYKGRVLSTATKEVSFAYAEAHSAASEYALALAADLAPLQAEAHGRLVYENDNQSVWLKLPAKAEQALRERLIHPKDRNGRIVVDKYSTINVEDCLVKYKAAAGRARIAVGGHLSDLAKSLRTMHDDVFLLCVVSSLIKTMQLHAYEVIKKGWSFATELPEDGAGPTTLELQDFFPYWLSRDLATRNSVGLSSLATLTGANMSGKSTLLRSVASATLLGTCGLGSPLSSAVIPEIDGIYLRTGSGDDVLAGLSAYAVELRDVAMMLDAASTKTLVLIDEFGKGAPIHSALPLSGAVFERLAEVGVKGLFSTHFFDLFDLVIPSLQAAPDYHIEMRNTQSTHRLLPGRLLVSHALSVAERLGIHSGLIERAKILEGQYARLFGRSSSVTDQRSTGDISPEAVSLHVAMRELVNAYSEEDNELVDSEARLGKAVVLDAGCQPAVSDVSKSCVYVLENLDGHYYVGETDDIATRLRAHSQSGVRSWRRAAYLAVDGGKSQTRRIEARLINRLLAAGFPMLFVSDGVHRMNLPAT